MGVAKRDFRVAEPIQGATIVTNPPYGRRLGDREKVKVLYRELGDFLKRRCTSSTAWILAGDAFGFLDPMYSTGVFLAMKSAEFAADAILEAFEKDDCSAAVLAQHGQRYVDGMESMRKLVYAFYAEDFSFARFLKKFPECREGLVDLLVGNVYRKPVEEMLQKMGTMVDLPDARIIGAAAETAR